MKVKVKVKVKAKPKPIDGGRTSADAQAHYREARESAVACGSAAEELMAKARNERLYAKRARAKGLETTACIHDAADVITLKLAIAMRSAAQDWAEVAREGELAMARKKAHENAG
ncbi:MAG: hypothetical protein EPN91_02175 [Salinibacterium sp.]|nr:MAG: hypothetical protein EPN91_02175 [Salinibacterium sp.]